MAQSIERDALKPGDHIYSWRWWSWWRSYAHHGIYVEENRVIHFVPSVKSSSSSKMSSGKQCPDCGYDGQSRVIKTCLDCFVNGGKIYRYEYGVSTKQYKKNGEPCHTVVAEKSRNTIIHRARYLLGHGFGDYSLTDNNCENFAIYCMTGIEGIISGQVDKNWNFIQLARSLFYFGFGETGEEYTREDMGDSSEGFCEAIQVGGFPREYMQGSTSPSLWKGVAEEFCAAYKKTV
ncbi:hypothetical protein SUGI_0551010 [Cryptomeria japonica]|uniref:protein LEAD-SENSITIVE 1 n=1 Tax=Cryptomeria japonica TaxID=3369 RepID=UPI002408CAF1|nr:protein LEAD-SENSITIVE 1 [Cryptomeria japonica]GLJ28063.1 hypothetical protein SUGI_0551010 [Cryptomeria japonica]